MRRLCSKLWMSVLLCCWMFLVGCGEDPQQLFETAQFEERQNNRTHARELYERIMRAYPESDFAKKAQQRIREWDSETKEEETP